MGNKRNKHAKLGAGQRREMRLEYLHRRELEILEEAEQERAREHRAAQKKEHHRLWRTRTARGGVGAIGDEADGGGPSGTQVHEESTHVESESVDDVAPRNDVETGGRVSSVTESLEENVVNTEATESEWAAGDEVEGERMTPRNRKCSWAASKGVNDLMRMLDSGFSEEEKRMVWHRYFQDERIRALDPELYAAFLKLRSVPTTTVQSLRGALQTIRSGSIPDKSKVRNIVLTAAVSKADSQRLICKALGASRYSVRKAYERRAEVDETGENLWAGGNRKRRSDALTTEETGAICTWWETETTVSPNKKDVKRRRIGVKECETHATHYLQVSQLEFHTRFRESNAQSHVGLRAFELLKPYYVRRLLERNTCACRYHCEMAELRTGWNNMRTASKGIHGRHCDCTCDVCKCPPSIVGEIAARPSACHAELSHFTGLTDMWHSVLCPIQEDGWHAEKCIKGECDLCGVDMLLLCPRELDHALSLKVQWHNFEMVVHGTTRAGKENKVLRMMYQTTAAPVFLQYLEKKLRPFILHNYVSKWQAEMYKESIDSFPPDSILSAVDFAENYTFQPYHELQSMHWLQHQITILVHICYRWNPLFLADPGCGAPKLLTEYHYYISDAPEHDTLFVQHCFALHWRHMTERGIRPNEHIVWSDGCAAQFKSRRCWYHVSRYPSTTVSPELPNGCRMIWSYFGSGHGKGLHDGAGAMLKCAIRSEEMNFESRTKLQKAADVVGFCKRKELEEHRAYGRARRSLIRYFHLIEPESVDRSRDLDCEAIPGSRSVHSVSSVSPTNVTYLHVRELACFCAECMDDNPMLCARQGHVRHWDLKVLKPLTPIPSTGTATRLQRANEQSLETSQWANPVLTLHENEANPENEFGFGVRLQAVERVAHFGDGLGDDSDEDVDLDTEAERVETGDTYVVYTDKPENGDCFFLVLCDMPVHRNRVTFTDGWGCTWPTDTMLISGTYYRRIPSVGRDAASYRYELLQDEPKAWNYSHLVVQCRVELTQYKSSKRNPRFKMTAETREGILSNVEERQTYNAH